MGLHICEVNLQGNGSFGEWVLIVNDSQIPVDLQGFELSDYTKTQQKVHVLHFHRTVSRPATRRTCSLGPARVSGRQRPSCTCMRTECLRLEQQRRRRLLTKA